MLVVLPPAGAFSDAASKFDTAVFDGLRSMFEQDDITLSLPKWQFDSENTLKDPLNALGMKAAFESGTADLSGMDGQPGNLYIDNIYHQAFIAVDELGTEAAAATAVVATGVSKSMHVTITFDRPFIFLVYDQPTGQILFLGHLSDPG